MAERRGEGARPGRVFKAVRHGDTLNTNAYSGEWFRKFLEPFPAERTEAQVSFLRRQLPVGSHPSVLDLCAGTGRIAGPLSAAGYAVTAVERDPGAVRRGRKAWPAIRFVEADVRDLSAVSGTFAAVLCLWQSFGYFEELDNRFVFRRMAERVAPGGRLVLDLYHRLHPGLRLSGRRHRSEVRYANGSGEAFDWELFTPEEIGDLGRASGLDRVLACARWDENVPADPSFRDFQMILGRPPV